jgi:hypothetical protein
VAGRLVRTVTTHDSDYTDDDLAAVLEWQAEQDLLCGGCRMPVTETMDPAADEDSRYVAEPVVCHACAARDRGERHYMKNSDHPDGVRFVVLDRKEGDG